MDFRKLASLQGNLTKVNDSADIEDKDLYDDIVKRYTGQKNLKLLKNPANGESLEKALKNFYKDKKIDCSLDGDKVTFNKVSDSMEELKPEEVEKFKELYERFDEWIDNGDCIPELYKEDGFIVYAESDVEESHSDDVKKFFEEKGYEEVDTDNHHDTWYQYFQKKVKDDSGEEQYDRGVKAGRAALEKGWTKEQTLKYYAELHKQFDEGLEKGFAEVKDSMDGVVEDYLDNFISRPLEKGMEIDLSDFDGLYDEESVRKYIEEKSDGKFTVEKIEESKAYIEDKDSVSDLEKAKDYFHNEWAETEEILEFDLTDDEVEELTEYVEELLDNDEDYEGDYPVIKKVDKTIHVYFD